MPSATPSDDTPDDRLTHKLAQHPPSSPFFSLEFFPPKTTAGLENLHPRLARLARLQPLFVTVTWGAGGSTATKSLELAETCQLQYGLTTCLHLTCTNMRRRVLDQALERCKRMGLRNILALRGDEPRREEYAPEVHEGGVNGEEEVEEEEEFNYAVDLVRYIRKHHGDWFCIGVAAYPEGHATSPYDPGQSPKRDLPWLREKTAAGADWLMTQLFYDVEAFLEWREMIRADTSGLFKTIPIFPGLMPVQSWGILTRTTKLSCAKVPKEMMERLEKVKGDDEMVKRQGVVELKAIIGKMKDDGRVREEKQGYHFYTLNLEKVVAQILEECELIPKAAYEEKQEVNGESKREKGVNGHAGPTDTPRRRRLSFKNSGPRNRVVVPKHLHPNQDESAFEATEDEAGVPQERPQSRANALATSEGQGSLGREATWDDFPNGRFGDARSPAYGSIDGYGPTLHVSPSTALSIWGSPETVADVSKLFERYLTEKLSALPWSEESLNGETRLIQNQLLKMCEKRWWSVASQPAVNSAKSSDEVVGWGPRVGGWVWQKPFVEFFMPATDWSQLKAKLDGTTDEFIYFAGDGHGSFESNDADSVNPVTWGSFKGKEITTPTIIEAVSFRAWQEEAFALWRQWQRIYPPGSRSSKLLQQTADETWLVNVIGHEFTDGGKRFWSMLLDE